ncbi:MAG: NAD(P)/FAD-dependent oxidoreductase [Thermofilum sp.]
MERELLVVGGGPAGAAAAIAASRLGISTLLVEKGDRFRDKYCGGGVTALALQHLKEIGAGEVEETFEEVCEGHVLVLPGERVLVDAVKGLQYGMVRRSVFDAKLREIAESSGAEVKHGSWVTQVQLRGDRVVARTRKGEEFSARYLVVSTGAGDRLPEQLGFPARRPEDLGHCWGTEAPYDARSQVSEWRRRYGFAPIFLFFGFVTYGYFWVFPKGNHMNVGMGTTLPESAKYGKLHLEGYRKGLELASKLGILKDTSPFRVDRSWLIPAKPRACTTAPELRTLLAGDAAGFVHPLTGEGISGSVRSGVLAARAVKEALDREDPAALKLYEESWRSELWPEIDYGLRMTRIMYSSPALQSFALRAIMADEKATKLLSLLLYRASPTATRDLYRYVVRSFPALAAKAVFAGKERNYSGVGAKH